MYSYLRARMKNCETHYRGKVYLLLVTFCYILLYISVYLNIYLYVSRPQYLYIFISLFLYIISTSLHLYIRPTFLPYAKKEEILQGLRVAQAAVTERWL